MSGSRTADITSDGVLNALFRAVALAEEYGAVDFPHSTDPRSYFFSFERPDTTPRFYARRLQRYMYASDATYICALVSLDRLGRADSSFAINWSNMNRLLITAVMIAAKCYEERCYSNEHYATVGGITSVTEMNCLEGTMLSLSGYDVFVNSGEILRYYDVNSAPLS